MKKLIKKVFGLDVYASSKNVKGRKSSGCEDTATYKNWRKNMNSNSDSWN
jgi:hypothetical protein